MPRPARLFVTPREHPFFNMALDEAVRADSPTFRCYGFDPAGITIGYFQRFEDVFPLREACPGSVLVRRVTGGGAIAHDGDLTFSIVARPDDPIFSGPIESSYERIHDAVADSLASLGAGASRRRREAVASDSHRDRDPICFHKATRYDLVANGRKLVGSAQRRTRERVLHHGSIPLMPNPLAPQAADVATLLGRRVEFEELADALRQAFEARFDLKLIRSEPDEDERHAARRLVIEKFGTEEWNRGR